MRLLLGTGLVLFGFLAPFAAAWIVGHLRGNRQGSLVAVGWALILTSLAVVFGFYGLFWLLSVLGLVCVCVCVGAVLIMLSLGMPIGDISGVLRGRRRVL